MKPVLSLVAALLALLPTIVAAHPLGNFTINRFARIEPSRDGIAVHFVVDMAEIPAFQELTRIGAADGRLSADAAERYARQRADELRGQLKLSVDGRELPLAVEAARLTLPEGQGGLRTLRLEVDYRAPARLGALAYQDDSYGDRLGWKEIVLRPAAGLTAADVDVPAESASDELRAYPDSMLQAPLNRRSARARLLAADASLVPGATAQSGQAGVAGVVARPAAPGDAPALPGLSALTGEKAPALSGLLALAPGGESVGALAQVELTWPLLAAALAAAAGFGALHALSPGHGKTVVAAYLVGARGTPRHALALGLVVTATHTWGVFALGLLTLYAGRLVEPERLYPWLSLVSGLLVVAMGLTLLRARLIATGLGRNRHTDHTHSDHHHKHHTLDHRARDHHAHGHHAHDHEHHHEHQHLHSHDGIHFHSHAPPENMSWRGLIMLGVVGGLLPCPSALILMLASIALGRIALGLGLVLAFSLGLATVLMAIGLLFVYARGLLDRLATTGRLGRSSRLSLATRLVPVASALAVTTAGLVISAGALPGVLGG
jgi:nickel/cobalt transporter (NicO) family protein